MNQLEIKLMGLALIAAVSVGGISAKVFAADAAAPAGVKLAIVDIEKAIRATSAGKKMTKDLKDEFDKKKAQFTKREGDLKKMFEDLEKKKNLLTDEAREKKTAEIQQERFKFQQEVAESQQAIQKREHDMLEPIAKKMEKVIDKMAKSGGYLAILDRRAILWGAESSDLTDAVVKEFEKTK